MYSKSEIAQAELLGSGANRYCVISPRDKSICLKIDLPASQRQVKNWRQALQRFLSQHVTRFNENYIEWIAYQKLKQRGKSHGTAVGAVSRKMVNIIFAVWTQNKPYEVHLPKNIDVN